MTRTSCLAQDPAADALLTESHLALLFGMLLDQKARIFLALLGKQRGITPAGWQHAVGAYGEDGARRSVADVVDHTTLVEVREFKKAAKAAAKSTA